MKQKLGSIVFTLCIAVGSALPMSANGQEAATDPLDKLLAEYQQAISAELGAVSKFEANYVKRLTALQQDVELKGDLNKVLKVKGEIEGYAKKFDRDYQAIPQLARMREIYEENITLLRAKASKRQGAITVEYANKFNQQKVSLTKSGELEAAVKADNYRKKILQQFEQKNVMAGIESSSSPALWSMETERDFEAKRDCRVTKPDGKWLLSGVPGRSKGGDWCFILSNKKFRPPFRIASRVATDSIEVRYYLDGRHLALFSWVNGPTNLNIHDPISGKNQILLPGKGALEKNRFYNITIDFTKDTLKIYVDGELRGERTGDYSQLEAAVGIGQACGSNVTVEKFEVRALPSAASQ